jgi:hypothetical protein
MFFTHPFHIVEGICSGRKNEYNGIYVNTLLVYFFKVNSWWLHIVRILLEEVNNEVSNCIKDTIRSEYP